MKLTLKRFLLIGFTIGLSIFPAGAEYRILHNFAGGTNDGATPLGSLIQSDSFLYGMTMSGGGSGNGTIFRMNTDGTGFQLLRSFAGPSSDGSRPYGSLLLSGSTLYGMAGSENSSYNGTLFKIGTDGADFQVVHRFAGPPDDGKWPYDSLIQSGPTLYGMTVAGGSHYNGSSTWGGTVFKVNNDGTDYQVLHNFGGGANDGQWSPGNLILSGSNLYGMTFGGGGSGLGTVFKIGADGTGFQLLHSFAGGYNDGSKSHGSLIQAGDALYGMTNAGGSSNKGVVFKIDTDGTDFQIIHSFTGGSSDGCNPIAGSLIQSGSMVYGMTELGGSNNLGTIFQMNLDGTDYEMLHSFTGTDGSQPYGSLFLSDSTLYGMTSKGGSSDKGVIFALDVPEPASILLFSLGGAALFIKRSKKWSFINCNSQAQK